MASPQLKNGHLRIANDLYRAVSLARLSPAQRLVLSEVVWRQYGWANGGTPTAFPLSPADVARRVGCTRESASRAVSSLVGLNMVLKDAGWFRLNKDFDTWRCGFSADPAARVWRPDRDETRTGTVTNQARIPCANDHGHRDQLVTVDASESTVAVGDAAPLEPVRTKENQGDSPVVPAGDGPVNGGLFKLGPPAEVALDADRVWAHWRSRNPTAAKKPTGGDKGQRATINARLAELKAAESPDPVLGLCTYIDWAMDAPGRAAKLRDGGWVNFKSLFRPSHVTDRMPDVRAWALRGARRAKPAPGSIEGLTPDQWWNSSAGGKRACSEALALFDMDRLKVADMLGYIAGRDGAPAKAWLEGKVEEWKNQVRDERRAQMAARAAGGET